MSDDEYKPFVYEGVKYLLTEDNEVVTKDYDYMGDLQENGRVEWIDEEAKKKHEKFKSQLKPKPPSKPRESVPGQSFESFKVGEGIRFRLKDNPRMIFGTIQTLFKKSEKMKIKVKNDSKQYEFKDLIKPEKATKTDVNKYESATFLEKGDKVIFKPPWIKSLVPGEITGRTAEGKWKISSPTGQFTIANDNLLAQVKKGQGRRITERQYELAVKALKNKQEDAQKQAAAAPEEATPSLPEEGTPPPNKKKQEDDTEDEDDEDYTEEEANEIMRQMMKMAFLYKEARLRKQMKKNISNLKGIKNQTESVKKEIAKREKNLKKILSTDKEFEKELREYKDDVDNNRQPYDVKQMVDWSNSMGYKKLRELADKNFPVE